MFYSSTEHASILDWVFSMGGLMFILIVVGIVWLIYNFFQNKQKNSSSQNNQNQNKQESNSSDNNSKDTTQQNNTEMESEQSYWDDFKTNEQYIQREEEPVPPNAIPPSDSPSNSSEMEAQKEVKVEAECTSSINDLGLYEKDCTKEMIVTNKEIAEMLVNEIPIDEPIQNKENENNK